MPNTLHWRNLETSARKPRWNLMELMRAADHPVDIDCRNGCVKTLATNMTGHGVGNWQDSAEPAPWGAWAWASTKLDADDAPGLYEERVPALLGITEIRLHDLLFVLRAHGRELRKAPAP